MLKLSDLIKNLDILEIRGSADFFISDICRDSRQVKQNCLFVAIRGFKSDGHRYMASAIANGAVCVVYEDGDPPQGVTAIKVADARIALAQLSATFFAYPADKMHLYGFTGTKGKTSAVYMLDSIFRQAGQDTALIGTITTKIGDEEYQSVRTTPESYDFQKILRKALDRGIKNLVMEVSSQGLKLKRIYETMFETAVFTNLYEDHIAPDEHENMDDYLQSKLKIFDFCKNAVINRDDEIYPLLADHLTLKKIRKSFTVGIKNRADVMAQNIVLSREGGSFGSSFDLVSPWYRGKIYLSLPGFFNVYNALFAIACAGIAGLDFKAVKAGLASISIKGRVEEVVSEKPYKVFVDYAHNAISLENLLVTMAEYPHNRTICVFGCGGDRARARRFEMGEVSGKHADLTIITSDNPRSEQPEAIMDDIQTGIEKTDGKFIRITDRALAIKEALLLGREGDIILIAGKGHETYQEFADRTIHFDDYEVAQGFLKESKNEKI